MGLSEKQEAHLAKLNANQKGENNRGWKGDKVGYAGLHLWVRKHKQPMPKMCEFCEQEKRLVVANLDGKYSRDLTTWAWLCYSCHLRHDKVAEKAWITKRRKEGR